MKLDTKVFHFELLTPCFSGTAYGRFDDAEVRIPPIRGHIRQWHRILFGSEDVNRVWGSASSNSSVGSLIGIRLISYIKKSNKQSPLLPHKDRGGYRCALPPETRIEFELIRLVGCSDKYWKNAIEATKLWLLLGGFGARVNRAAGSVYPLEQWTPTDKESLKNFLTQSGLKNLSVALIGYETNNNKNAEQLRKVASDTYNNHPNIFGSANPRKPSPLKFKVFRFNNKYCLIATAPKRGIYGQNRKNVLLIEEARNILTRKPPWKELGDWEILI